MTYHPEDIETGYPECHTMNPMCGGSVHYQSYTGRDGIRHFGFGYSFLVDHQELSIDKLGPRKCLVQLKNSQASYYLLLLRYAAQDGANTLTCSVRLS